VANLSDAGTQQKAIAALRKVPGVAVATVLDPATGTLAVQFAPMAAADKAGGPKGATQDQITKALADAGLTATVELAPAASSSR
jgi:hypothetical protein